MEGLVDGVLKWLPMVVELKSEPLLMVGLTNDWRDGLVVGRVVIFDGFIVGNMVSVEVSEDGEREVGCKEGLLDVIFEVWLLLASVDEGWRDIGTLGRGIVVIFIVGTSDGALVWDGWMEGNIDVIYDGFELVFIFVEGLDDNTPPALVWEGMDDKLNDGKSEGSKVWLKIVEGTPESTLGWDGLDEK